MGALGFGIFDDDHACDIRNTYRDLISLGASETDCTAELVRCFVTPFLHISETLSSISPFLHISET